jgi:hypothetical protein
MPTPTLEATPGLATSNSYCTVAEAETYFDSRLSATAWSGASAANKIISLIMATRVLDASYVWYEWPVDSVQVLQWPRVGMIGQNPNEFVPTTVIPQALKEATAELAMQLITEDRTLDSDIETKGLRSLTAGPVGLVFKDNVKAKVIPDAVYYLIPTYWGYPRVRGTGQREVTRA